MVIRVGLSDVTKRERGELDLRVVLTGRKFHSHPALRPGRLIVLFKSPNPIIISLTIFSSYYTT